MAKPAARRGRSAAIDGAIGALLARFGNKVVTSEAVREQHGHTTTWIPNQPPDAVVFAASTGDVQDTVRICGQHRVPVIPFGTGTSLEGHVNAPFGGICIDVRDMNRVLAVHAEDLDCVIEPGITRKQLNEHLRDKGLFFPLDPGADASLGGMAATRASGTNAVRYGTMKDNVIALKAVLPNGEVMTTAQRAKKSSAGYDLTRMFVGSEGTFGVITELTLRLHGNSGSDLGRGLSLFRRSKPHATQPSQRFSPVFRSRGSNCWTSYRCEPATRTPSSRLTRRRRCFSSSTAPVPPSRNRRRASARSQATSAAVRRNGPRAPRSAASCGRRVMTRTGRACSCGRERGRLRRTCAFRSRGSRNA